MLIFLSWYVSLVLLYVNYSDTCFIEGQHIIINYFIFFIFLFFSIYLLNFLLYFHKMKKRNTK
jgi:hypothetical protein